MTNYLDILLPAHEDWRERNLERDHFTAYAGKGDGSTTFVNADGTARREVYYYEKKGGVAMPPGVAILADNCPIPYENNANNVDKPVILARKPGSKQYYMVGVAIDAEGMTSPAGKTPLDLKTAGAGTGTVTSVALTVPTEFSVSGSPVTTTGTLAVTKANQNANLVFAGPTSGGAAAPTFRALVAADIPAGSGVVDQTGTAGETLSANDYCYLNTSDNKWYKVDIDATGAVKVGYFRGFATGAITINTTGTIRTLGVLTGFTGLTAGTLVYATTTAGGYTQTRPTLTGGGGQRALIIAGYAISTTAIYIQPNPVQFQIRDSVSAGATLTVEHYSDAAARLRKLFAYTSVTTGGTLTSYSSANHDQGVPLRGGTGAGATNTITNSTLDGQPIGNSGGTTYLWAQSFQVTAGVLTSFTFQLRANFGSPSGTMTWEICSDTAGAPGTVLETGTLTPTPSATNTVRTSAGTWLAASTTYWLKLYSTAAQSSNNYWSWYCSTTSLYASGTAAVSTNAGASWSNQTIDMNCAVITTASAPFDRLAQSFQIGSTSTCDYVTLYLRKFGSPTGTMTLRIETNSGSAPSGTLADANATITVAESGLSTSYSSVTFNFTDFSLTGSTTYWLVLSTDRTASATNYVTWGGDGTSPGYASGNLSTYASSTYTADANRDMVFSVEGPTTSYESELDIDYWGSSQAVILNRYDDGSGGNADLKSTIKNGTAGALDVCLCVELP